MDFLADYFGFIVKVYMNFLVDYGSNIWVGVVVKL